MQFNLPTAGLAAMRILRSAMTGSPFSLPTSAGSRWEAYSSSCWLRGKYNGSKDE